MSDVVYTAAIEIVRIKGPHRHAWLPAHEGPVEFGVHGAIQDHHTGLRDRLDRRLTTGNIWRRAGGARDQSQ